MYVDLSRVPDAPKQYQIYLNDLSGGVNYSRAPSEIADNQCSEMTNMLWESGVLRSRRGQRAVDVAEEWSGDGNTPFEVMDRPWHGRIFMALAGVPHQLLLATYDIEKKVYETIYRTGTDQLLEASPSRGSFFRFGENLYFKCFGAYIEITYDKVNDTFSAADVVGYRPVIQINSSRNGVGDLYQPENRLSDEKEIWYDADPGVAIVELPADGESKDFYVGYTTMLEESRWLTDGELLSVDEVYVAASLQTEAEGEPSAPSEYSVDTAKGKISFYEAPPIGTKVTARVTLTARRYRLPDNLQGVEFLSVQVMGDNGYEEYERVTGNEIGEKQYAVASVGAQGIAPEILFGQNFGAWNDAAGNANYIKIIYRLPNEAARRAIMFCDIATEYGATGVEANCVVMAGTLAQRNAIFWSGSDANGANPAYFPMDQYNLVGEYADPITAFGRQQNKLVIFQENRVSSATYSFDYVGARLVVSLPVKTINDRIGCDRPRTVQLVENNLVWFSSKLGVMYLQDSTYAYETLVKGISGNVNARLLGEINTEGACSFDDGSRYWLCLPGGSCYVWDYSIQGYTSNTERLRWFPQDGIEAVGWCVDGTKAYGCRGESFGEYQEAENYLFDFSGGWQDLGENMLRSVVFKTQTFGTFAYTKNVEKIIFALDGFTQAEIDYTTDYEGDRKDLMDLDTSYEADSFYSPGPKAIRVRKPKCRHIQQFTCALSNKKASDLAISIVQIFYTYNGTTKAGIRM